MQELLRGITSFLRHLEYLMDPSTLSGIGNVAPPRCGNGWARAVPLPRDLLCVEERGLETGIAMKKC